MKKLSIVVSLLIAAVLVLGQIGVAQAQAGTPVPPISGTIKNITIITDTTTNTQKYVEVEVLLADNTTQTVKLSLQTAADLGLIIKQSDGTYLVDQTKLDPNNPAPIIIEQNQILQDTTTDETGFKHPIGLILEMFFGKDLGIDYDTIMQYHEDGTGFGVLAQAMWMTKNLDGDSELLDEIIAAKKSGDYSNIILPDGSTATATNWGQLRKELLDKGNNLGATMDKGNGKPDDKGNGKPDDKGNGKDKNKDKGNGKP